MLNTKKLTNKNYNIINAIKDNLIVLKILLCQKSTKNNKINLRKALRNYLVIWSCDFSIKLSKMIKVKLIRKRIESLLSMHPGPVGIKNNQNMNNNCNCVKLTARIALNNANKKQAQNIPC